MNFSVVIPTFNAQETIGRAIRSVYTQSLSPFEIIVVDDCSSDETISYIKDNFPGVRVFRMDKNSGPSAARNTGIQKATGDWIAFLDADDTWFPKKLETITKMLKAYPEKNLEIIAHRYTEDQTETRLDSSNQDISPIRFWPVLFRNYIQSSCICLKKASKIQFDETFRYCEDHELAVRVSQTRNTAVISGILSRLGRPQLSKGGLSGNQWAMRKGEIKIYTRLYKANLLFILLIPFLVLFSLGKYLNLKIRQIFL